MGLGLWNPFQDQVCNLPIRSIDEDPGARLPISSGASGLPTPLLPSQAGPRSQAGSRLLPSAAPQRSRRRARLPRSALPRRPALGSSASCTSTQSGDCRSTDADECKIDALPARDDGRARALQIACAAPSAFTNTKGDPDVQVLFAPH